MQKGKRRRLTRGVLAGEKTFPKELGGVWRGTIVGEGETFKIRKERRGGGLCFTPPRKATLGGEGGIAEKGAIADGAGKAAHNIEGVHAKRGQPL